MFHDEEQRLHVSKRSLIRLVWFAASGVRKDVHSMMKKSGSPMRIKQRGGGHQFSPRWTDAEVERLRSLASKMRIDDISRLMKRSRGAVTAKAFMLRLSLNVRDIPDRRGERSRHVRR
jgi:hypothetical protein